jgi:FAD/FMN-containing dehydrogenase
MIQPDSNGLYHPANENDIVDLITYAIQNKKQVRVRGAAESFTGAVYADGYNGQATSPNINIELDQLRAVTIDPTTKQATVGGGCNLGFDPFDPSGVSAENDSNNLFFQLNQYRSGTVPYGLALPNVPDVIHQTIAGFISTGSSGGSIAHSFDECILSVRMVDGTGKVQTFSKADENFYGVVVSMGLLGIITQVTLQCVPAFNIIGTQTVSGVDDCEFDFFGNGSGDRLSFQEFLTKTEYTRTMWWPFNTLKRAVVYKARTMTAADYNPQTGYPPDFTPKPFKSIFPAIDGTSLPAEAFAATGFNLIATWPDWFYEILNVSPNEATFGDQFIKLLAEQVFPYFYPMLINIFFKPNDAKNPPQNFWDYWLNSLPMDKVEFSNNLFNLAYTEMWIPVDKTSEVLTTMQKFYGEGYAETGFFTTEIFAAPGSNFWLSPAYKQDVVRINILWFNKNAGDPVAYFQKFWDLLQPFNFRPHWGKSLPAMGDDYMQANYPQWGAWKALRNLMDPNQIFVNDYWRKQLGI